MTDEGRFSSDLLNVQLGGIEHGNIQEVFGFESSEYEAYLARDGSGSAHFLVPVLDDVMYFDDDKSEGVRLGSGNWDIGSERKFCLDCYSMENSIENETSFCALVDRVLGQIRDGRHPSEALQVSLDAMRDTFKLRPKERLGRTDLIGLWGELIWLERLAEVNVDTALQVWKGDIGGSKDFETGSSAIEVKSSTDRGSLSVKISSLSQLSKAPGQRLYLSAVRLMESSDEKARSVPQLLDDLVQLGVGEKDLIDRLSESSTYRYLEIDRKHYEGKAFSLFDENLFEVRGAFPAITREDLSETVLKSIEDLQYTVNLEGLEMYKVPDENFPEILSDLTKVEDSA